MTDKEFNTAGPCIPEDHYMINPLKRFSGLKQLLARKKYFILHAPRQTGKTTTMLQFAKQINQEGQYIALYVNIEIAQAYRNQINEVNRSIIDEFKTKALIYLPKHQQPDPDCYQGVQDFSAFLSRWCLQLSQPLVVFMDEVDSLIGDSLLSVLRQIRSGYAMRPKAFPHAMCLIGLRDIRDYRIFSDESQKYVVGGSAFNIKEKSCRIEDFSLQEVHELYAQHTQASGQAFETQALDLIYHYTRGQPWLVNALGRELCFEPFSEHKSAGPPPQLITEKAVRNAVEILIKRRDVHLDQLLDKITEPRVERIIQPLLLGEMGENVASSSEDQQYLIDLGLIRRGELGLEIANPIYQEVIPRQLTVVDEGFLAQNPLWYIKDDGRLDMALLMDRLITFYKENAEIITQRKTYTEAAHHLVFMAWIHRIVNGGGRVQHEYALGLKRIDMLVEFADERFAFELKLNRSSSLRNSKILNEGKAQLIEYLNRLSLDFGRLLVFRTTKPSELNEIGQREIVQVEDKTIEVIWF